MESFFPLLLLTELIVVFFIFQIQDLEATIHKKDMELNDLNARWDYCTNNCR